MLKSIVYNVPKEEKRGREGHLRHIDINELSSLLKTETLNDTIGIAINIRFFGILNPLNVYFEQKTQRYYAISGYEKLAALCILGKNKVFCNVITDPVTCDGIVIDEYILKANKSIFDVCAALTYLTDTRKYGISEISSMTGISTANIKNYMSISRFSAEEKRTISLLGVDEATCFELSKIDDPIARENVLNHIKQQRASIKNVCKKGASGAQFAIDDGIIDNTISQMVSKLSVMGLGATYTTKETENKVAYTITVNKRSSPK